MTYNNESILVAKIEVDVLQIENSSIVQQMWLLRHMYGLIVKLPTIM